MNENESRTKRQAIPARPRTALPEYLNADVGHIYMNNTSDNYWHPVEAKWRERFLDKLQPHLAVSIRIHNWAAQVAAHHDITSHRDRHVQIARLLVRRLGEEYRAVELLSANGHGFQAITAACNLFEQAHWLIYICSDAGNAKRFENWENSRDQLLKTHDLVNQSGKAIGWDQQRCDDQYDKYRSLCGFKHNNPVFQRILQMEPDPDLYMAQFALAESSRSIMSSFGFFAVCFMKPDSLETLLNECCQIMDSTEPLFPQIDPEPNNL